MTSGLADIIGFYKSSLHRLCTITSISYFHFYYK